MMHGSMIAAIMLAGLIAIAGASFGVVTARLIWAEDLHHAQELRKIWNSTEGHLRARIELLEKELGR